MTELLRRSYGMTVRALQDEKRSVDVIASSEAIDAYGEIVIQDWDLKRYQSNPVVLYGHDARELPIGHASDVRVEDGKLLATLNLVDERANPKAEQVWQGIKQGSLRAVSVGFRTKAAKVVDVDGKSVYHLTGNELVEISIVPIPANPEAVAQAAKSLDIIRALAGHGGATLIAKGDGPAFTVGSRVRTAGPPHMDGQYIGEVREAVLTYAYGIVFEGMEEMGVHRWYVESELAAVNGGSDPDAPVDAEASAKRPKKPMHDMPGMKACTHTTLAPAPKESHMSKSLITLAALMPILTLAATATEEDAVGEIGRLKSLERDLLTGTGAKTGAEALGIVQAGKSAIERVKELEVEVQKAAKDAEVRERAELIAKGKADKKLAPALVGWAEACTIESLKGFLDAAPAITQFVENHEAPKTNPSKGGGLTTIIAEKGLGWKDLAPMQKHNLLAENPDLYAQLKNAAEKA